MDNSPKSPVDTSEHEATDKATEDYLGGIKLASITLALCLATFLVALVRSALPSSRMPNECN
jgi:hypothetical protein